MKHTSIWASLLLICCLIGGAAFDLGIVRASAPLVVDSIGDQPDNNLADNLCHTAAGTCTLRAAIQQANATSGVDTISFDILGTGVHTITPTTALPTITDPVTIDGYSQPGAGLNTQAIGDDAVLLIELAGNGVSGGISGLFITAGSSTVRGLVINRWLNSAIDIRTNGNNTIVGNFIGTDATGAAAGFAPSLNNGSGVTISSASDNTIGGLTPAARNIISGSRNDGIAIIGSAQSAAARNIVQGNYIGTDKSGTAGLGNGAAGLAIDNAADTTVGGTTAAARNLISGNLGKGIFINSSSAARTVVQANYIGTDITGNAKLGNGQAGLFIQAAADAIIGGNTAAPGLPPGNLISGNSGEGIHIVAAQATGNLVAGNLIGTNQAGTSKLANASHGVTIANAPGNTIGGTTAGMGNAISGNGGSGVFITGAMTTGTLVQGNAIGSDIVGAADLGNAQWGVTINSQASQSLIGGTAPGASNTIAFNGADGVQVTDGTGNALLTNAIFSNADLGIDLGVNGVGLNDLGDADSGGNMLQNFPVLALAGSDDVGTNIQGALNSSPNTSFRIEFFASDPCNAPAPNNYGEGRIFLGAAMATTDSAGNAAIQATLAAANIAGQFVSATATNPGNNTSEFSACIPVTQITPTNTPTSTPTNTPVSIATNTPTSTPTNMPTNTPVSTATSTPTRAPTSTATSTPSQTATPTSTPQAIHPGTIGFWRNWRNQYTSAQIQVLIDYLKANDRKIYNKDSAVPSADDLTITKLDTIFNYGSRVPRDQQILGQSTALMLNLAVTQLQGSNSLVQKNSNICRGASLDISGITGAQAFFGTAKPTIAQVVDAIEQRWIGSMTTDQTDWRFDLSSSAEQDLIIKVLDGINQGTTIVSNGCAGF